MKQRSKRLWQEMLVKMPIEDRERVSKNISEIGRRLLSWLEQNVRATNRSAIELLLGSYFTTNIRNDLDEMARRVSAMMDNLAGIMVELGWPPVEKLDTDECSRIITLYRDLGADAIREPLGRVLVEKYDRNTLENMLAEWKMDGRLSHRFPILEQGVLAHFQEHYSASVCTLLPQIEGLILERHWHPKGERCRMNSLRQYVQVGLSCSDYFWFDRWANEFYTRVLMAQFTYGEIPSELSRHAILHGYDTQFGTAANSLKAILIFDYFQRELNRIMASNQGKCFHLVGCPKLNPDKGKVIFYEDYAGAIGSGKTPCKFCKPEAILRHR